MQEMWVWSLGWEDPLQEETGNPLQYSCLRNPMDRGAWQATVHGIAKELDTTKPLNRNKVITGTPTTGRRLLDQVGEQSCWGTTLYKVCKYSWLAAAGVIFAGLWNYWFFSDPIISATYILIFLLRDLLQKIQEILLLWQTGTKYWPYHSSSLHVPSCSFHSGVQLEDASRVLSMQQAWCSGLGMWSKTELYPQEAHSAEEEITEQIIFVHWNIF